MSKYGSKTQKEVAKQLHEFKHERRWKSRKRAIAVGLSKAREKGLKAPPKQNS